jgi:sensor histidine kinase YesM
MAVQPVGKLSDKTQFTLLHIGGWIIYSAYLMGINSMGNHSFRFSYVIGYIIPFIVVFYASLYCLQFFNRKYGAILGVTAVLLMFGLLCLAVYVYVYDILPLFGVQLYLKNSFNLVQFIQNIVGYTIRFFVFALLYFVVQNYYRKKALQAQSEAALLRAQIQPHFLYNTLNTFYAQAHPLSEDLANNIHKLSDIMRYSLEQVGLHNEMVLLSHELKQLQLLIDINQLRFSHGLFIIYEVNGEVVDQLIPPLSLITLVENAFKHGNLKDPAIPLKIIVTLSLKHLHFYCSNKKRSRPVYGNSSCVGMNNLKKRLDFSFKNHYKLMVRDEETRYSVSLTINY